MSRCLWVGAFFFLVCAPLSAQQGSVLQYLPNASSLDGWETLGEPQIAEGADLFLLINGGAEIYNEYGFVRAAMHSYEKGEKSVNLEVYEMEDVASAYGAYSFKTDRDGEPLDIGSEARFEEYYLNFWKGNVVVTLIGFDTDQETRDAILTLGRLVEDKISLESARPELVELLPPCSIGGEQAQFTYVEGNLALINRYRFGNEAVFEAKSAVVGDYGDQMIFLFAYESETQTFDGVAAASDRLASSGLYTEITADDLGFAGRDRDSRFLLLRPVGKFAVVCLGATPRDAFSALEDVASRLALHAEGQVP